MATSSRDCGRLFTCGRGPAGRGIAPSGSFAPFPGVARARILRRLGWGRLPSREKGPRTHAADASFFSLVLRAPSISLWLRVGGAPPEPSAPRHRTVQSALGMACVRLGCAVPGSTEPRRHTGLRPRAVRARARTGRRCSAVWVAGASDVRDGRSSSHAPPLACPQDRSGSCRRRRRGRHSGAAEPRGLPGAAWSSYASSMGVSESSSSVEFRWGEGGRRSSGGPQFGPGVGALPRSSSLSRSGLLKGRAGLAAPASSRS